LQIFGCRKKKQKTRKIKEKLWKNSETEFYNLQRSSVGVCIIKEKTISVWASMAFWLSFQTNNF